MRKPTGFVAGMQVKLTDHRKDRGFREEHYDQYDEDWQRFWDEYVDRQLTVVGEGRDGGVRLNVAPKYLVEEEMLFWSHEIEGIVEVFDHDSELFRI